ncbi:hypothetical protein ACFFGH_17020 [Lysobacter korlensis]|uniref:Outer membrane protein beta-barrel domain-containing protein n=1 Tax=Lysobacter korlensis TaxID=553636 RepID=A0ABV6RRF2_9GAMM
MEIKRSSNSSIEARPGSHGGLALSLLLAVAVGFACAPDANAQTPDPGPGPGPDRTDKLDGIKGVGFGPAFYFLRYKNHVIEDARDVRVRTNGTLEANQTRTSSSLGLEVHANLGKGWNVCDGECTATNVISTWGWKASPYLGVFDVSDGINGLTAGVVAGVWRGDKEGDSRTALNLGIGYFTHKNQLVLADDVQIGQALPAGLAVADATRKTDVSGITVFVSASMGF